MIFGGRLEAEAGVNDCPTNAIPAREEAGPRYDTNILRMTDAPTCQDGKSTRPHRLGDSSPAENDGLIVVTVMRYFSGMPWDNSPAGLAKKAAYYRRYRKLRPERISAIERRWRNANPEKRRAKSRRKQKRDRLLRGEFIRARDRIRYRKKHGLFLERGRRKARRRRMRLYASPGSHTEQEWLVVLAAHGHRCAYCSTKGSEQNPITRDHYIALAKGGSDEARNLVPSCRTCNLQKTHMDPLVFVRQRGLLL
jgi:5-methylcytosine-specific restriction endonuclease McrA